MSKKRMLADVLWEAANVCLSEFYGADQKNREEFSCHATYRAVCGKNWRSSLNFNTRIEQVDEFLSGLGCEVLSSGFDSDEYSDPQGVRYMWLLLAMHVAEDEGIEV